MPRLLGYRKFTSKKGKLTCVAAIALSPTEWEKNNGFVGENVKDGLFIPDSCIDRITPDAIGCEIELKHVTNDYGKAELKEVIVKK